MDLLLVIDNSPSMAGEAQRLGAQLDGLLEALADLHYGFPDARIGVISTDLGTGSVQVPGCSASGDDGFLLNLPRGSCEAPLGPYIDVTYWDGVLRANLPAADADGAVSLSDIQAALRCIGVLGSNGCAYEQPLEAARRALTCTEDECRNPDFLRPQALLAVVFVTDEDDCSAKTDAAFEADVATEGGCRCFDLGVVCTADGCEPAEDGDYLHSVQGYSDFFGTVRPENRLILGAVTGPFEPGGTVETTTDPGGDCVLVPSCTRGAEGASPAVRIGDLVRRFGENGLVLADHDDGAGICGDGLPTVLRRLREFGFDRRGECMGEPLLDPSTGALLEDPLTAACVVTEVSGDQQRDLPRCAFEGAPPVTCPDYQESPGQVTNAPCWYLCDAGEDCLFRWMPRWCRESSCSPWIMPRPGTDDWFLCLTCDPRAPGCLCGDGVCDEEVAEDAEACPEDCAN